MGCVWDGMFHGSVFVFHGVSHGNTRRDIRYLVSHKEYSIGCPVECPMKCVVPWDILWCIYEMCNEMFSGFPMDNHGSTRQDVRYLTQDSHGMHHGVCRTTGYPMVHSWAVHWDAHGISQGPSHDMRYFMDGSSNGSVGCVRVRVSFTKQVLAELGVRLLAPACSPPCFVAHLG